MAVGRIADRLEHEIPPDRRLAIETSAAIAYLHGGERASPAAAWVFDGCLATGRNPAVMSALSVAELMVGPSKAGAPAGATMEGFFRFFAQLEVVPLDASIARTAARLRASSGLALPDAVVVATALAREAAIVVTNDARWASAITMSDLAIEVCLLDEAPRRSSR